MNIVFSLAREVSKRIEVLMKIFYFNGKSTCLQEPYYDCGNNSPIQMRNSEKRLGITLIHPNVHTT